MSKTLASLMTVAELLNHIQDNSGDPYAIALANLTAASLEERDDAARQLAVAEDQVKDLELQVSVLEERITDIQSDHENVVENLNATIAGLENEVEQTNQRCDE